jgi:hypothetical protein
MVFSASPSFRDFKLTDFLIQLIAWRNDLALFFKDITGLSPRGFQADFFREVQDMKSRNIVIVAGRGIGKTIALAVVALWYVFVLSITLGRPMKVTVLAGSLSQANICYGYVMSYVNSNAFFQKQLDGVPTKKAVTFKDGSWIRPLPCSERTVRGEHPDLLIMDEAAQVEDDLVYAALPMTVPSPYARNIFSTTPKEGFSWIEMRWEHQAEFKYPDWKFFNWNSESFMSPEDIEMYRQAMPEDRYRAEFQGLPYKREGKVFRLIDLKKCNVKDIARTDLDDVYAGLDWGYYPAPTVLVVVQHQGDRWLVLKAEAYLAEEFESVHTKIEEICRTEHVKMIFSDSTDKGENLRLAARHVPLTPVSFKGEKSVMLSNLKMLVEKHLLEYHEVEAQPLNQQMIDYVYDSKRNDDYVDALMLAVKANPMAQKSFDLAELLKESKVTRPKRFEPQPAEDKEHSDNDIIPGWLD